MESLWKSLGNEWFILFGLECGRAALWIFVVLIQRTFFEILRISDYVPYGLYFALPLTMQYLSQKIYFWNSHPLLLVRIAESILGRVRSSKLMFLIPANFIGNIFGVVVFTCIFPLNAAYKSVQPIMYPRTDWLYGAMLEVIVVFFYVCIIIGVPMLLSVNRLSTRLVSLYVLPLFFIGVPVKGSIFNPGALYALWFVNRMSVIDPNESCLQLEHIAAPFLGAVLAGLFCNVALPDDSTSWIRKEKLL